MTPSASHRQTTSSRKPGVVLRGRVWIQRIPITTCPKCGGLRKDLGGPHSPRLEPRGHDFVRVDCAGNEVLP